MKILQKQRQSIRAIARQTGRARNTVRKYLRSEQKVEYKKRAPRPSKLTAYIEYLLQRVEQAKPKRLFAPALLREIQELGYQGKISTLRNFLQGLLEKKKEEQPVVRFETEPGKQMQVDWIEFDTKTDPLYIFIGVMGYSRMAYLEVTKSMKVEVLVQCHQNAFEFFGGVPAEVLYDNMKTVLNRRDFYGQGKHQFQAYFWDFAKHCAFIPRICRPYRPQTKGKVERFVRYFKDSCYYPLVTKNPQITVADLNFEAKKWLIHIANQRLLRAQKAKPEELFQREKEALQPLPPGYRGIRTLIPPVTISQHPLKIYEQLGAFA